MAGRILPNLQALTQYQVNDSAKTEGLYYPLYDFQTYAAAGQSVLTFFQNPQGQSGRTLADTNMLAAGQVPRHTSQLVTSLEVVFYPGVDPAQSGLNPATAVNEFINDVYAVMKSGYLIFKIGSKNYAEIAPIGKVPAQTRIAGFAAQADSTTAAATQLSATAYGAVGGASFEIVPLVLEANQNFSVSINWPTAVALPSGQNGRIGVYLNGFQYRSAQ